MRDLHDPGPRPLDIGLLRATLDRGLRAAIATRIGRAPRLFDWQPRDGMPLWCVDGAITYDVIWQHDADARRDAIIGVFESNVQHSRAHAACRALRRAGFDGRRGLAVVESYGAFPTIEGRLQSLAPGPRLDEIDTDVEVAAQRAGLWLGALHRTDVGGSLLGARDIGADLDTAVSRISRAAPEWRGRLLELRTAILARLGLQRAVPSHGRFAPEHVYVSPGMVTVDGLTAFGLCEPERDLGSFIAAGLVCAMRGGCELGLVACRNRSFLDGYHAAGGNGTVGRVSLWTTIALLARVSDLARLNLLAPSHVPGWLNLCARGVAA